MEIKRLIEISQNLGFEDLEADLNCLSNRMSQGNYPIVLPLVGEWSAGKTTLLNALLDNNKLETDFDECTSTIYEVHFGCEINRIRVIREDGVVKEVDNIEDLKNAELTDAKIVEVYDTSKRVSSSTILVDTPGINSKYAKNNQTLIDFLPKADGVLLVLDINQGMLGSTINHEFVKTISLSKRPIYVVFTKCHSKNPSDIKSQIDYLKENASIKIEDFAWVSALEGDLGEFERLLEKIQTSKDNILKRANEQRIEQVAHLLCERIDGLIKATCSDDELENAIQIKRQELERLNNFIDDLVWNLEKEIKHGESDIVRKFDSIVFEKLYSVSNSKGIDFDSTALSAINNTMSLMLCEYKDFVKDTLFNKAREIKKGDGTLTLRSLESIDVSSLSIQGPDYNLSLNELGHEYDGYIAAATKVALVVAVAAGGAALAGGGAVAATSAANAGQVAGEAAKGAAAASQVGGQVAVAANQSSSPKIVWGTFFDNLDTATDIVFEGGQMFGKKNGEAISSSESKSTGLIDLGVKLATDEFIGKPQRRRAIHDYVESVLTPSFRSEIKNLTRYLIASISEALHEEASQTMREMTNALEGLRVELKEQKTIFEQRIKELKEYENELKED